MKKPTKQTNKELKRIEKKETNKKLEEWKAKGKNKWGDVCEVCGSDEVIQGHHFMPKHKFKSLMFDLNNYVPLCRSCHFKLERTKQVDIGYKIIIKRGIGWLKRLNKKL